jgi:hypothetical protein
VVFSKNEHTLKKSKINNDIYIRNTGIGRVYCNRAQPGKGH